MSTREKFQYYYGAVCGAYLVIIMSTLTNHLTSVWTPLAWLAFWIALEIVIASVKKVRRDRKAVKS